MARTRKTVSYLPSWTKRVATDLGGRDPLGLSRVAQWLADNLLPGIITTTNRARYYGLYAWAVSHGEQCGEAAAYDSFEAGFQRRESAIAVATLLHNPETPPVGKRAAATWIEDTPKGEEFTTHQRVLPANRLGGYGQYYSGSLQVLGLTERNEEGVHRVRDGAGRELAAAVDATVTKTAYIKGRHFSRSRVPRDILESSAELLSIDAIQSRHAQQERRTLVDVFFGFRADDVGEATRFRRQSLSRLLATVRAYESARVAILESNLDDQLVYAPAYFGVLASDAGKTTPCVTPAGLERCTELWQQFCLHQYLTWALEDLLTSVLEALEARRGRAPFADVVAALAGPRFVTFATGRCGGACNVPRDLLARFGVASRPTDASCRAARSRFLWNSDVSEQAFAVKQTSPDERAARACLLLAVLYATWRGRADTAYAIVSEKAGPELCAPTVLPYLDRWLDPSAGWSDVLHDLVALVVAQHDRVMFGKGRLESSWLRLDEGALVHEQEYQPTFRSPRHHQAVSILVDLDLLAWAAHGDDRQLGLTSMGRTVLDRSLAMEEPTS